MKLFIRYWPRIAVTLLPLLFALLHASNVLPLGVLHRLDDIIYDARLRATMPQSPEHRIVIIDIDEKSLAEVGRWPWGRNKMAALVNELFERQQVAIAGFDVVFAEADESSGLKQLQHIAARDMRDMPGFASRLAQLESRLDYDALFAASLAQKPVILGYYMTSDREGRTSGVLPAPIMQKDALRGRPIRFTSWSGYGSNIDLLAKAAPRAGYFNAITDIDGVVRSIPLLAEYQGQYYESLSLAMFRHLVGSPQVEPGFPSERWLTRNYKGLESIRLVQSATEKLAIPVDERIAVLVPFRGRGGPAAGSFQYHSAADVLQQRLPAGALKNKIVLLGTTAPGLQDLRVTPVGETYPGVEVHANVISGLMEGRLSVKPDYSLGFEVLLLTIVGIGLAVSLPLLTAPRAVALSLLVLTGLVGLNFWLYLGAGLVLPLASSLAMALAAFALNMSYGYFVESKSKRQIAHLFGTYVPPELVDEMVKDPDSYNMKAQSKELTVMFCDMRGFTQLSETMDPAQLQELLNRVFSQLTEVISNNRGTIDKYMGDCVMAFWGSPVDIPSHAFMAVKTATEMVQKIQSINAEHRSKRIPEIGVGIGLNTGLMCVGDMGSSVRKSYTVIGDAVNLGSRLEGLSKVYGVEIIASDATRRQASAFAWQELDKVRVKGKEQAVTIYSPIAPADQLSEQQSAELKVWSSFLREYRTQNWDQCDVQLLNLQRTALVSQKALYQLYLERVAFMKRQPFDPAWDGATRFESK